MPRAKAASRPLRRLGRSTALIQELAQLLRRNRVRDAAGLRAGRLATALDQDAGHDADDSAALGVVGEAPAVTRVGGSVELEYGNSAGGERAGRARIELVRPGGGNDDRRDRGDHRAVRGG